ncbi:hypothetical protein Drose_15100 [Dactylosporangium roseum]|uniref:Uncharacterized protein n=1 Tax=Dactylosporangium roseum TaxID=47989 RepID=A0ABY5ZBF1_9ACTN|nr:hypothetical protein [Dactylosporangium roseum]UWZ39443.1 hypothetical protein Drose_15100 [Dactylosporangium roseum]
MHVFPAAIPSAEAPRVDVVEVRVARKVAPLFGLGADLEPFRRTWVCDYTQLSLAEIGRGAPFPDRATRARWDAEPPPGATPADGGAGWAWSGRAVWSGAGTLPGALSNATLNRYGPDTKAAVVLSAANRLLRGPSAAVAAAARWLAETGCDAEVRLAVWAGLVLEVYRAQPALVVAAVQARQVQRSLSARWGGQVDPAGVTAAGAPCEIGPPSGRGDQDETAARWRPTDFDLVDATLPALRLADDSPIGPGLVTSDAVDDMASAWCHRLLGIGRPGRGVLWLIEEPGGARRVQAMVRVGAVVAPFVAATLGGTVAADRAGPPPLPVLPEPAVLAAIPRLHQRAHLLAAHVAASYVRYRDEWLLAWPQLRARTAQLVADAVGRCANVLDADDPVPVQLTAYAAYLRVWDGPRTSPGQHASDAAGLSAVAALVASQQQVAGAWRAGRLDPGAATYLLELGVVALDDAARHGDDGAVSAWASIGRWWPVILQARGLGQQLASIETVSDAQAFHLHHYAAWLATGRRCADLQRALMVQERVAQVRAAVARGEPAGFAAKSAAARAGHELAAEIATDLALATSARQRTVRLHAVHTAARYARAVLADPSMRGLLLQAGSQPAAARAATAVARALSVAVAHGVALDADELAEALALIDAVLAARDGDPAMVALCGWRSDLVAPDTGYGVTPARQRERVTDPVITDPACELSRGRGGSARGQR